MPSVYRSVPISANDVYDYKKGADTETRVGPLRTAQAGLLTPTMLFSGLLASYAAAFSFGIYLAFVAGWPVVAIGLASLVCGVAYTGGPYPLGYNGLGDLFVFVFFGVVAVVGTVFVQSGAWSALALVASFPAGALATNILVVNNIRDARTDAKVGKRTLAVRLGIGFAKGQYIGLLGVAFAVPSLLAEYLRAPLLLLPWLCVPIALTSARVVLTSAEAERLNACLKRSALLLLAHSSLFALGFALSA